MDTVNLPLILGAALVALPSPGPATLAIAGTSMASGRKIGMCLGLGVFCGSLTWSISAAFGLSALMLANVWIFDVMRYAGAGYLIYLAYRSARAAVAGKGQSTTPIQITSAWTAFRRGYAIHITNPKAILFFGSLYSIGVPQNAGASDLITVIAAIGTMSFTCFIGYGWLFSIASVRKTYEKLHKAFNTVFALAFGAVGIKLLTTRLV
jgi:threonine efflux protein